MSIARVNSFAFAGIEAQPVEVQVQIASGLPNFLDGRPARQSGGRGARTGARRAHRHGPGAAAQARAGQPRPRRPAEGGQPFRPADRARRARRHGCAAARGTGAIRGPGRIIAGWPDQPGGRRAAGGHRRGRARAGADLPGGARRRSGLGRRISACSPHRICSA